MHQKLRRLLAKSIPDGVERFAVKDRDEWLRWRKSSVTASVAGGLLGVHEYTSRYQLHMLKSGRTEADPTENPAMRRGRLLEPVAVQCLQEDHADRGWIIEPCGFFYNHAGRGMGATPDTVAWRPDLPGFGTIQIKTVQEQAFKRKWVQEDRSVRPPDWIVLQAIQEAKMIGASWASVAPMVVGFGIEIPRIDIPIHEGIWARLVDETAKFWDEVREGRVPEPDYALDGDMIESMWDPRTLLVDLSTDNELPGLLDERERLNGEKRDAEGRVKEIRNELLHKVSQAAVVAEGTEIEEGAPVVGVAADGRRIVVSLRKRAGFTSEPTSWTQVDVRAATKPKKATP